MSGVRVSEVNLLKRMIADGLVDKARAQDLLVDVAYRRKKGEDASLTDALVNSGVASLEQLIEYAAANVPSGSATSKRSRATTDATAGDVDPVTRSVQEQQPAPPTEPTPEPVPAAPFSVDPESTRVAASTPAEDTTTAPEATQEELASTTGAATPGQESFATAGSPEPISDAAWDSGIRRQSPGDAHASAQADTADATEPTTAPRDEEPRTDWQDDGDSFAAPRDPMPPVPSPEDGFPPREFIAARPKTRDARFSTGRRLTPGWIALIVVVVLTAGGVIWWLQRPAEQLPVEPVRNCFVAYRDALTSKDGAAAAQLIDTETVKHYRNIRFQALMAKRSELAKMSELDRFCVLALRNAFKTDKALTGLTGADVFAYFVDTGWIRADEIARLEIGDVTINGRQAIGQVVVDGREVTTVLPWRFHREAAEWRIQVLPEDTLTETTPGSTQATADSDAAADDAADDAELLQRLEQLTGSPVRDGIWEPLVR